MSSMDAGHGAQAESIKVDKESQRLAPNSGHVRDTTRQVIMPCKLTAI